jgi:hypothetical protein
MLVVAGRDDKPQHRKPFLNKAVVVNFTVGHFVLAFQTKK